MRIVLGLLLGCLAWAVEPLQVVATVPELGLIAREVLGDAAEVTVLARSREDPHQVIAKPSFIPRLRRADLLLEVGMELEVGWLPPLLAGARRNDLERLAVGSVIQPLGVPTGPVDRSHGHIHASGNPHALCDPLVGWRVARAVAEVGIRLRPEAGIAARRDAFAVALAQSWVGLDLPPATAAAVLEKEDPVLYLGARRLPAPGGWYAALAPLRGRQLVADHDLWPYLARRAGFTVVAFLEPRPGVPPTEAHLAGLTTRIRAEGLGPILVAPYRDQRQARRVAAAAGTQVIELPHQPGEEDVTYRGWIDRLVRLLAAGA